MLEVFVDFLVVVHEQNRLRHALAIQGPFHFKYYYYFYYYHYYYY